MGKQAHAGVKHLTIPKPTIPVIHGKETFPFCLYTFLMSGEPIETGERARKMACTAAKGCGTCQAQEGNKGTGVMAEDWEMWKV